MEPGLYSPLPDDWTVGVADIVSSTKAIAAGHYKSVNMAGASVISAVLNALDRGDYPFVFGGDGALVAVPPSGEAQVRRALAAVRAWVMEELHLDLRTALVPLTASIARRPSSSSASSTPQVKAPWAPPPCSPRLRRRAGMAGRTELASQDLRPIAHARPRTTGFRGAGATPPHE